RLVPKLAYYFGNASAWSYLLNIRWHTPTIRNYLCSPRILLLLLQLVQDRCSMTTPCGPVLKPVFSPSFHSRSPPRIWVWCLRQRGWGWPSCQSESNRLCLSERHSCLWEAIRCTCTTVWCGRSGVVLLRAMHFWKLRARF